MVTKLIEASQAKSGVTILIDGVACMVRTNDTSKTGKHGHTKCRIEAIGVLDGKKKVIVAGGSDRFDCPMIIRENGQILSIMGDKASVMDMKSFETLEISVPEELKAVLKDGDQIEYWDVEGIKLIKRKI